MSKTAYAAIQTARKILDCEIIYQQIDISNFAKWKGSGHLSQAAYYRLGLIDSLASDRCLYLDVDTLVTLDISSLLDQDLCGHLIGAVDDPYGSRTVKIPMHDKAQYFNSGVMLMDLDGLRHENIGVRFSKAYDEYEQDILYADQCVLNNILEFKRFKLARTWNNQFHNAQIEGNIRDFSIDGDPFVLHYSGPHKPWMAWYPDSASTLWFTYARLLGLSKNQIIREPTTLSEVMAMIQKHDSMGDFKSSAALRDSIIKHLTQKIEARHVRQNSLDIR